MLFNTIAFAKFFILIFFIYWALPHRWKNRFLLIANYSFYAIWDWRFLTLLLISTALNYYSGLMIREEKDPKEKKRVLVMCVVFNLCILGVFKYFGFFIDSLVQFTNQWGWNLDHPTLTLILPLGISFFTFQGMSYPIDVYRKVIEEKPKPLDFAIFVSFFPNLISGPIERAKRMLPQIKANRNFEWKAVYDGGWLIFWGLYKKILIADNLDTLTRNIFNDPSASSSPQIWIGMLLFSFQIYADFSGYSDMARGLAKMLGFDILQNFKVPFFAKNLFDFWQRWHISLTNWIKEYLYYPLALTRIHNKAIHSSMVILLSWTIMGLWHGPSGKFIIWGLYHGALLILYSKMRPLLKLWTPQDAGIQVLWRSFQGISIFVLFSIGILCFACHSVADLGIAFRSLFIHVPLEGSLNIPLLTAVLIYLLPLFVIEAFQYKHDEEFVISRWHWAVRGSLYYGLFYLMIFFGVFSARQFYYFQF